MVGFSDSGDYEEQVSHAKILGMLAFAYGEEKNLSNSYICGLYGLSLGLMFEFAIEKRIISKKLAVEFIENLKRFLEELPDDNQTEAKNLFNWN